MTEEPGGDVGIGADATKDTQLHSADIRAAAGRAVGGRDRNEGCVTFYFST